jgi:polyhydroxybutyrate depolymerase
MKRFISVFINLLVYGFILMGCTTTSSMTKYDQGEMRTFKHNGLDRTYSIYLPDGIDSSHSVPLLVALHGGGGSAKEWPKFTNSGFEKLAKKERFILVYPNGLEGQWNDGRGVKHFYSQREGIDDTGFLGGLIDELTNTLPIDKDRIYVVGASNGGMMTHKLAAEYSGKIAAIATVISSIPKNLDGKLHPTDPVSVLMINGTEDPLVRWEGGEVKFGRKGNGYVISTNRTFKFWADHNKCDPAVNTTNLPDRDPTDGTSITRSSYSQCEAGTEVVLYKIIGGGHTWPAYEEKRGRLAKLLVDKMIGRRSRDADACEVIWEFLKNHPKRHTSAESKASPKMTRYRTTDPDSAPTPSK